MHAGKVRAGQRGVADVTAGTGHEVDHARRQAGFLEDLHEQPWRVDQRRSGLPEHGIAHDGRRGRQVAGDGREIEGRYREHETFQRPVLNVVPDARRGFGLLLVDLLGVGRVETQEVDQFAGRVDLGLEHGLAAVQHGAGVHQGAVFHGQQIGRLQENGHPLFPAEGLPVRLRGHGCVDGFLHLFRTGLVVGREHVPVVVGHDALAEPAGLDPLAANDQRNLDLLRCNFGQGRFQRLLFRAAGGVVEHRFIARRRGVDDGVVHQVHGLTTSVRVRSDYPISWAPLPLRGTTKRNLPDDDQLQARVVPP